MNPTPAVGCLLLRRLQFAVRQLLEVRLDGPRWERQLAPPPARVPTITLGGSPPRNERMEIRLRAGQSISVTVQTTTLASPPVETPPVVYDPTITVECVMTAIVPVSCGDPPSMLVGIIALPFLTEEALEHDRLAADVAAAGGRAPLAVTVAS